MPCESPAVAGLDLPGGHLSLQARPPALYEWYSISSGMVAQQCFSDR